MTIPSHLRTFEAVLPPWLLRTQGRKLFWALSDVLGDHRVRLVAGVKLRFPGLYSSDGLDLLSRERRLRRGPAEDSDVFARRLRRWWIDHRTRGNGFALLEQLRAYLAGTLAPPFEVVSYLGVRHRIDGDGPVTRDSITWGTDESGRWTRIWLFLRTTAAEIDAATREVYAAILRDWIPAHVRPAKVVVLHPGTRLWDYPGPLATWDSPEWPTWASATVIDATEEQDHAQRLD
jgi:hypothetical protein